MKTMLLIPAVAALLLPAASYAGQVPPQFPGSGDDFFNLGPTGAQGIPLLKDDAEKAGLKKCNGLKIEKVYQGTSADGALQQGDVVWLVRGKPFPPKEDPVLCFSAAVEAAESSKDGFLKLKVMRAGRSVDVELKLGQTPPHSKTCPDNWFQSRQIRGTTVRPLSRKE